MKIQYDLDTAAKIVRIRLNKAERWWSETDRQNISQLMQHFIDGGITPIVED